MKKLAIFLFLFLFFLPVVKADVITKSPSSTRTIVSGWNYPTRAYTSDNSRTYSSTNNAEQEYAGYGFNIPSGATIEKVEVGAEWYTTSASDETFYVKVLKGGSWYTYTLPDQTSESLYWKDVTGSGWTPEQVNNIKTRIRLYKSSEGGCYANNTYFIAQFNLTEKQTKLKNQELLKLRGWTFLNPEQILDLLNSTDIWLLAWNDRERSFFLAKVRSVDVHEGNWTLYDIWSGEVNVSFRFQGRTYTITWKSHTELTGNHPIQFSLDNRTWVRGVAEDVYNHFKDNITTYINHVWLNYTLKAFPVTNVTVRKFNGRVYNIRLEVETPDVYRFAKTLSEEEYRFVQLLKKYGVPVGEYPPFLFISGKWTSYVDWLPVRVTYTVPSTQIMERNFTAGLGLSTSLRKNARLSRFSEFHMVLASQFDKLSRFSRKFSQSLGLSFELVSSLITQAPKIMVRYFYATLGLKGEFASPEKKIVIPFGFIVSLGIIAFLFYSRGKNERKADMG